MTSRTVGFKDIPVNFENPRIELAMIDYDIISIPMNNNRKS
ncbi:MAG TPA: hypothetical protein VFY68_13970 [Nitrososphaeraceae archaeon]|nr:hypothetical protein [Nitrososphaeraceae archaeon]